MQTPFDTVIVLTTGKQDRGTRATLAFSWGCAALAMGQRVALYLTMDGTIWASRGAMKDVAVAGFEPLQNYQQQFVSLGGQLLVCSPCSEYYCDFQRDECPSTLVDEATLVGLATIVARIGSATRVITF